MTLSGGAGKRVPRDVLHLKSPNLWKAGTWRNRETAGDITRTGGEARQTEGPSSVAPLGGSFSVTTSARRELPGLPRRLFPA